MATGRERLGISGPRPPTPDDCRRHADAYRIFIDCDCKSGAFHVIGMKQNNEHGGCYDCENLHNEVAEPNCVSGRHGGRAMCRTGHGPDVARSRRRQRDRRGRAGNRRDRAARVGTASGRAARDYRGQRGNARRKEYHRCHALAGYRTGPVGRSVGFGCAAEHSRDQHRGDWRQLRSAHRVLCRRCLSIADQSGAGRVCRSRTGRSAARSAGDALWAQQLRRQHRAVLGRAQRHVQCGH